MLGRDGVINGQVIALDILAMDPVEGVTFMLGDFQDDSVLAALSAQLKGQLADLVISDMAPNLSGVSSADSARIGNLCEIAQAFAVDHLKPEGALIVKAFHGSGFSQIVEGLKRQFKRVVERKPKASRDKSSETFLVAKGLK
jgi:23S rRNA (uridine2552-2'-O)-methyltransferase